MDQRGSEGAKSGRQDEGQLFRVLIVDDNEIDREIIIRHIRHAWPFEGLAWESATDGTEALKKLAETSFAVIVLEWQLPKMHGVNVLHKLRADGMACPAIVVSGLDRQEITDDLESLGAAFVNKECINPAALRDAMAVSARWLTNGPMHRR